MPSKIQFRYDDERDEDLMTLSLSGWKHDDPDRDDDDVDMMMMMMMMMTMMMMIEDEDLMSLLFQVGSTMILTESPSLFESTIPIDALITKIGSVDAPPQ